MVFVSQAYDVVVNNQFHNFYRKPFARVLYLILMKDIDRWLSWIIYIYDVQATAVPVHGIGNILKASKPNVRILRTKFRTIFSSFLIRLIYYGASIYQVRLPRFPCTHSIFFYFPHLFICEEGFLESRGEAKRHIKSTGMYNPYNIPETRCDTRESSPSGTNFEADFLDIGEGGGCKRLLTATRLCKHFHDIFPTTRFSWRVPLRVEENRHRNSSQGGVSSQPLLLQGVSGITYMVSISRLF